MEKKPHWLLAPTSGPNLWPFLPSSLWPSTRLSSLATWPPNKASKALSTKVEPGRVSGFDATTNFGKFSNLEQSEWLCNHAREPKNQKRISGLLFGHLGKFSSQSWQSPSLPQAIRTCFTALPWARSFTFVGGGAIHLEWFWSCQAVPGGQTNWRDMTIWNASYIIDEVSKGITRYSIKRYSTLQ